jgi:hypothetical protein
MTGNDHNLLRRQTEAAERATKAAEDQAETARNALSEQRLANHNGTRATAFAMIAAIASAATLFLSMCSMALHH